MANASLATRAAAAAAERQRLLSEMNPELRKEVEKLLEETSKMVSINVTFYYRLGERARKVHLDAPRYGDGAMDKLAAVVCVDRSVVYKTLAFVEKWTWDQVKAMLDRRTAGGNLLTWSHISQLIPVQGKEATDEMVELIFREDLSVRELRDLLMKRSAGGARGGAGKGTPKTLMGGLNQVLNMATHVNQKFAGDFEDVVFAPLHNVEDGEITEDMLRRVSESKVALETMAENAETKAKELGKVHAELVKAAAAAQKEAAKAAKAAEDAPAEPAAKPAKAAKPKANGRPAPGGNGKAAKGKAARRERRPIEA